MEKDLRLHVVYEKIYVLAKTLPGDKKLFVILRVHEVILITLRVQKLHGPFHERRLFKLVIGAIGPLKLIAVDHVPQLCAVEGLPLAGF